jgi:hypothetical protein
LKAIVQSTLLSDSGFVTQFRVRLHDAYGSVSV